jgi:hypothetical protein
MKLTPEEKKEHRKLASAKYRAKNKKKIAAINAAYRAKNKDKIASQQAAYYAKNKDKNIKNKNKKRDADFKMEMKNIDWDVYAV